MSTELIFKARTNLHSENQKVQYLRNRLSDNPADEDLAYFLKTLNRAKNFKEELLTLLRS